MSFFTIFRSHADNIKRELESITPVEVQNRIDGERGDIYQQGDVINNYFGCPNKGKSSSISPVIDISSLSDKEKSEILGYDAKGAIGWHEVNGQRYNLDEDGEMPDVLDMTDKDWEIYGSYDNWAYGIIPKEYFNKNDELIAEYGSYKNFIKNEPIESKIKKVGLFTSKRKLKKEALEANKARARLRKVAEENRLKETERFKNKSEKEMLDEAMTINKKTESSAILKAMKEMNKRSKKQSKIQESFLEEIKRLNETLEQTKAKAPQLTTSSVVNGIMSEFEKMQRNFIKQKEPVYIDTKVI